MNNLLMEVENEIAVVTINRPKSLNALNSETLAELDACFSEISERKDIKVVILTGSGAKAFVAGADISEMVNATPAEGRKMGMLAKEAFLKLETMPQVTIAAVNGFALGGGCEISMACDIRIASAKAKFGQPEVGLGITPGFSGTQRLPRLIGVSTALEMILTGKQLRAKQAVKLGLVDDVVPHSILLEAAVELAKQDPGKKAQLQKFMDYYLPTALKLLNTYASLHAQDVQGENIADAKKNIERSMDLLVTAFENQLDKLFQSDALDVSADVAALEGMLNMDGLTGSDFAK